ncbi:MAG: TorF family putative porin [Xanthobacteraceae bacterium]
MTAAAAFLAVLPAAQAQQSSAQEPIGATANTPSQAISSQAISSQAISSQVMSSQAMSADTGTKTAFGTSVSGTLTSDYNYRGYTLSNHLPSAATDIEATYGTAFADINAASVDMPQLSQFQMTDSAGIRPVFGPLTFEVGAEYYSYPGSDINIDYVEFYAAPTYLVSPKLTLGLNVYYAPNYDRTGTWENYNSATLKYTLDSSWSASGEIGRQRFGTTRPTADSPAIKLPDYTYWNFGISYTYKILTADLRYYDDTLSKQSCFLITGTGSAVGGSNGCSTTIIGSLTWSLNVSDLK